MLLQLAKSGWSKQDLESYLKETRTPLRLACINNKGFPAIVPLWYQWDGHYFWCVTHQNALILEYLAKSPRVGFEVANNEPPYYGVRGQGEAELIPAKGADMVDTLVAKYLPGIENDFTRWLLSRRHEEVAIKIYPHVLSAWDYRQRMQLD